LHGAFNFAKTEHFFRIFREKRIGTSDIVSTPLATIISAEFVRIRSAPADIAKDEEMHASVTVKAGTLLEFLLILLQYYLKNLNHSSHNHTIN